ncbi:MAG: hypothetical protein EPN93_03190 [Spirochaetes bacterium]|nr:MAG: hypothetical protein EPN93_03190 [Spirochaetota bacterium]
MNYSTKEVIDIAIAIEDTGYYFYTQCRNKFEDRTFRELFGFLAQEELRHREIFEKLHPQEYSSKAASTDEFHYNLRAISESKVFKNNNDVDTIVKNLRTPKDVFKVALTAEKDSILWYSEVEIMYEPGSDTHIILGRLIGEERRHVVTLLEVQEKMGLLDQ